MHQGYCKLPFSLAFFVFAVVVAAVNLFTPLAILLYFLFSPFWVAILVNLGFVGLGAEAAIKRVSPLWLVAPLCWFGGYAIYAFHGHAQLAELQADIPVANARAAPRFDPAKDVLVLRGDMGSRQVRDLMQEYDIKVIFEEDRSIRAATGQSGFRAWRVETASVCDRVSVEAGKRDRYGLNWFARTDKGEGCFAAMPDTPLGNLVEATVEAGESPHIGLQGQIVRVKLRSAVGENEIVGLTIRPPSWYPVLIVGCDFFKVRYEGKCGVWFYSPYEVVAIGLPITKFDPVPSLAKAINLKRRQMPARPSDPDQGLARLAGKVADSRDPALLLETFLRNPKISPRPVDIDDLASRRFLLTPHAARIAEAAIAAARADNDDASLALQRLLAGLHSSDLAKVADRLVTGFVEARKPAPGSRRFLDAAFVRKLGDLREASAPLLEKVSAARVAPSGIDMNIAYCRAGMQAKGAIEGRVQRTVETADFAQMRPASRKVMAVSALRIGRTDLADRVDALARQTPKYRLQEANKDTSGVVWSRDYPAWRLSIGPHSGPEVCDVPHLWYD